VRALLWLDVAVFTAFWLGAFHYGPRTWLWYVGLAIGAVSVTLWIVAKWQLGSSLVVRPEARRLVTSGLYSRVRHPIYVFGGLAYFGALLALQWWTILIPWLIVFPPVQWARARREDRVLESAFGDAYRTVRERAWF
jgi:protein-S-isoprenylcysteine O-methyltransferase Ste14